MAPIISNLTWVQLGWREGVPHPTWKLALPDGSWWEIEQREDNGRPWTRHYRISYRHGIAEGDYPTLQEAQAVIYRRLGIEEGVN